MYVCMYIYIYIDIHISISLSLTASGRGQDNRGRYRTAAIPHNRLPWEAKCGNMRQHVRTQNKELQNLEDLWPFCENPVCPAPRRTWGSSAIDNI